MRNQRSSTHPATHLVNFIIAVLVQPRP